MICGKYHALRAIGRDMRINAGIMQAFYISLIEDEAAAGAIDLPMTEAMPEPDTKTFVCIYILFYTISVVIPFTVIAEFLIPYIQTIIKR